MTSIPPPPCCSPFHPHPHPKQASDQTPATPLLEADLPWETYLTPDNQTHAGFATPYSGGIWRERDGHYRMWYNCGRPARLCYATSADGIAWDKPRLDVVPGTNLVLDVAIDNSVVWRDEAGGGRGPRWVLAAVPRKAYSLRIYESADGIHWTVLRNATPRVMERSTLFFNPFRSKWVYSIKVIEDKPWRRSQAYWETDAPESGLSWDMGCVFSANCSRAHDVYVWTGADAADPPQRYNSSASAQLYGLDVVPYESLMLGLFTIFTGFEGGSKRNSGELNEIYLGFSRDGFNWWRPQPRTPVARMAWPVHFWRNNGVQTVGAGLHVLDEELRLYTSGRSGMPFDSSWGGGNTTMGLWQMRRDGFVSLEDALSGQPGNVTTRTLVFEPQYTRLFVNVAIQPGGYLKVAPSGPGEHPPTLGSLTLANSRVHTGGGAHAHGPLDSTCAEVRWQAEAKAGAATSAEAPTLDLKRHAGRPMRLHFQLYGASLYSFWVSDSAEGTSRGHLGAGGTDN